MTRNVIRHPSRSLESTMILDHLKGISLDPNNPPLKYAHSFHSNHAGLEMLAKSVREHEKQILVEAPWVASASLFRDADVHPFLPCAFNWYSITLVNHLQLIALVELMNLDGWKAVDLANPSNHKRISNHCKSFVRDAVPEVWRWRNKVAAHAAATDPFHDDNVGTLESSVMNIVDYSYPYYYVGMTQLRTNGFTSELPKWALTETHERLAPRFWPESQLQSVTARASAGEA